MAGAQPGSIADLDATQLIAGGSVEAARREIASVRQYASAAVGLSNRCVVRINDDAANDGRTAADTSGMHCAPIGSGILAWCGRRRRGSCSAGCLWVNLRKLRHIRDL